ncbi:protein K48-linked ubiquitination, partial [Halocaridina rubra]
MEIMKCLGTEDSPFGAPAACHYLMAFGYSMLCLHKMAQYEAWVCNNYLETAKSNAIHWPGSDDIFPESNPNFVQGLSETIHCENKYPYSEERSLMVWRSLPLYPSIAKQLDNYPDFVEKYSYMEKIITFSIETIKREYMNAFSRGEKSYRSIKSTHTKGRLLGLKNTVKPKPIAICRFEHCIATQGVPIAKEDMYLTDPYFRGYINVICEECCSIAYHPVCWKAHKELKEDRYGKMSEKDFLGMDCFTPDCSGKIMTIYIYDEMGKVKHELVANKKNTSIPAKQKKKKEKKKATQEVKPQPQTKKKLKAESGAEEAHQSEEPGSVFSRKPEQSSVKADSSPQPDNNEELPSPVSNLPIDPESLDRVKVVIKPPVEEEAESSSKTSKKNKKKNKKRKKIVQPDFLVDPLDTEMSA